MKKEQRILCLILFISIFLNVFLLSNITQEVVFQSLEKKEFQMDEFRKMQLSNSIFSAIALFDQKETLPIVAGGMLLYHYNLRDFSYRKLVKMLPKSSRLEQITTIKEVVEYYKQIISDIVAFPVADRDKMKLNYENSWQEERTYGGKRFHEGTDLIPSQAEPGQYKVLSMTNGVVEKMGWLNQGGWRVGVRSESGSYFYYAHLDSYQKELSVGDLVKAGDVIGFMGDSGYGEEGTTGKFPVHLHMGIYLQEGDSEISVNPYWILKWLEKNTNFKVSVI